MLLMFVFNGVGIVCFVDYMMGMYCCDGSFVELFVDDIIEFC